MTVAVLDDANAKLEAGRSADMERALRFGADRLCLWVLCENAACTRAQSCRGDARLCAGRIADRLDALDAEKRMRPDLAEIEQLIATPDDLRAYRLWRKARDRYIDGRHLIRAPRARREGGLADDEGERARSWPLTRPHCHPRAGGDPVNAGLRYRDGRGYRMPGQAGR